MISKLHMVFSTLILATMLSASACTPMDETSKVSAASDTTTATDRSAYGSRNNTPDEPMAPKRQGNQSGSVNLNDMLSGKNSDPQAAESCQQQGGNWQRVCRKGTYSCVKPYSDAGQSCSAQSDCEGRCLANKAGNGGVCQSSSNPCGCFSLYTEGMPTRRICID